MIHQHGINIYIFSYFFRNLIDDSEDFLSICVLFVQPAIFILTSLKSYHLFQLDMVVLFIQIRPVLLGFSNELVNYLHAIHWFSKWINSFQEIPKLIKYIFTKLNPLKHVMRKKNPTRYISGEKIILK